MTGTDTGVGKTVVSAALMLRCRAAAPEAPGTPASNLPPYRQRSEPPLPVRYWKPVQTGIEVDDDTASVKRLAACGPAHLLDEGVRLPRPVSPHLAARLSGRPIAVGPLVDLAAAQPPSDRWIVEGAGGVLVPLNDGDLMIDLMIALALPVVVAARSTLGTINHTLLTLEALRGRRLSVAGVVLVGPPDGENRAAIQAHGRTVVLGQLPHLTPLTPAALERWAVTELDPDGRLEEWLR